MKINSNLGGGGGDSDDVTSSKKVPKNKKDPLHKTRESVPRRKSQSVPQRPAGKENGNKSSKLTGSGDKIQQPASSSGSKEKINRKSQSGKGGDTAEKSKPKKTKKQRKAYHERLYKDKFTRLWRKLLKFSAKWNVSIIGVALKESTVEVCGAGFLLGKLKSNHPYHVNYTPPNIGTSYIPSLQVLSNLKMGESVQTVKRNKSSEDGTPSDETEEAIVPDESKEEEPADNITDILDLLRSNSSDDVGKGLRSLSHFMKKDNSAINVVKMNQLKEELVAVLDKHDVDWESYFGALQKLFNKSKEEDKLWMISLVPNVIKLYARDGVATPGKAQCPSKEKAVRNHVKEFFRMIGEDKETLPEQLSFLVESTKDEKSEIGKSVSLKLSREVLKSLGEESKLNFNVGGWLMDLADMIESGSCNEGLRFEAINVVQAVFSSKNKNLMDSLDKIAEIYKRILNKCVQNNEKNQEEGPKEGMEKGSANEKEKKVTKKSELSGVSGLAGKPKSHKKKLALTKKLPQPGAVHADSRSFVVPLKSLVKKGAPNSLL